jgi:hypothetical protein
VQHSGEKFVFLKKTLPREEIRFFLESSSPSAADQALREENRWFLF